MGTYTLKPEIQMVKDLSSILSSIDWSSIGESFQSNNTQLTTEPTNPETPSVSNQEQLNEIMDKILNREKFSYDLNGDALYQQYKDKYLQQGKMAMEDAIGQASTMTGGYGNSYAQSVGQQAYQAQLENLNDIVPELWQMAYDRYNQERQALGSSGGSSSDSTESTGGNQNGTNNTPTEPYKVVNSENVALFKASIRTRNEFARGRNNDKKKYGSYEAYIEGMLDKWLTNGQLNENEVATLIKYYGLA